MREFRTRDFISVEKEREILAEAISRHEQQNFDCKTGNRQLSKAASYANGEPGGGSRPRTKQKAIEDAYVGARGECTACNLLDILWTMERGQYFGNKNSDIFPFYKGIFKRAEVRSRILRKSIIISENGSECITNEGVVFRAYKPKEQDRSPIVSNFRDLSFFGSEEKVDELLFGIIFDDEKGTFEIGCNTFGNLTKIFFENMEITKTWLQDPLSNAPFYLFPKIYFPFDLSDFKH